MPDLHFSIEARAYDIGKLAAHDFWVLRDPEGKALGQLHGLAATPDERIKPIGTLGDQLKFYHFGLRARLSGLSPAQDLNFIKPEQRAKPMFSGSPEEVLARWDHAVTILPYLNRMNLPYTPLGILAQAPINSNTAYALLGKLMDIPVHYFSGYWQPGWKNTDKILTTSQLALIRYPQPLIDTNLV